MIQFDNKFNIGQEVYKIGRVCSSKTGRKRFAWILKTEIDKPVKILGVFCKRDKYGNDELSYNIEKYGMQKENQLFTDYELAKQQCDRWNEEGYKI